MIQSFAYLSQLALCRMKHEGTTQPRQNGSQHVDKHNRSHMT